MQEGPVPVTVTVTCPQDGKTASDTVTIQVIRPAAKVYTFEDVHFDFDRYTLRPEALRVLEQAVAAMKARRDAAPDRRRPHLQHRHGRIQPGARRAPRQRGARLPDAERRRRDAPADRQLRRGKAEARQLARRDAPAQPPRGARRAARLVAGTSMLADLTMIATLPVDEAAVQKAAEEGEVQAQQPETPHPTPGLPQVAGAAGRAARRSASARTSIANRASIRRRPNRRCRRRRKSPASPSHRARAREVHDDRARHSHSCNGSRSP